MGNWQQAKIAYFNFALCQLHIPYFKKGQLAKLKDYDSCFQQKGEK